MRIVDLSMETNDDDTENDEQSWTAPENSVGERIDKFMAEVLEGAGSRTQIQQWIKQGLVKINGNSIKPNQRLEQGDMIVWKPPSAMEVEIAAESIPLDVVFEDSDLIVVNKPRGMVVHPAPGHFSGTLVNALLYHCKDLSGINGEIRPGIVHRIDKDTSGLIVAAKNDKAHTGLAEQLKEHTVTRKYLAIVHGNLAHDHGTIDAPIGRDVYDRKRFAVTDKNSKHAVTHFAVIEQFKDYSYLELKLETGRTHQIRVHMQFIGHPLIGDPLYGKKKGVGMEGQALHAAILGFVHPRNGEYLEFEAELPEDMRRVLHILKNL